MTETIKIPRFSPRHPEHVVFSHVEKFAELATKLYRTKRRFGKTPPSTTVLRELGQTVKLPVPEIQELFEAVIDASFAYRIPEHSPIPRKFEPIFSDEYLRKWNRQKLDLKATIKMHKSFIIKLQKTQEDCWKSRDKVKENAAMVDAAQLALQHYRNDPAEYKARNDVLKDLKKTFTIKQKQHIKNITDYENLVIKEKKLRGRLKDIAINLRTEITGCIRTKLEDGFNDLMAASYPTECTITYDIGGISERLYDITCKQYEFGIPPVDPTSTTTLKDALYHPRIFKRWKKFKDTTQTYGRTGSKFTITTHPESQKSRSVDNNLLLRNGDKGKLLFMASDRSCGFGWVKHSSLSFKKWGFFQISDLIPKHRGESVIQTE